MVSKKLDPKRLVDPQAFNRKRLAFQRELVDKMSALATAAFGLVAALAWNSAIQKAFERYVPAGTGVWPLVSYAIVVTLVAVLAIMWIGRIAGRLKAEEAAQDTADEAKPSS